MRYRIKTLMVLVTICALILALVLQSWRAARRERDLQVRLQQAEANLRLTELRVATSNLEFQLLAASHQQELLQLGSRTKNSSNKAADESGTSIVPNK